MIESRNSNDYTATVIRKCGVWSYIPTQRAKYVKKAINDWRLNMFSPSQAEVAGTQWGETILKSHFNFQKQLLHKIWVFQAFIVQRNRGKNTWNDTIKGYIFKCDFKLILTLFWTGVAHFSRHTCLVQGNWENTLVK